MEITTRNLTQGWKRLYDTRFKADMLGFDEPSQYGIDGGKISKLWIKDTKTDEVVCSYDRGWEIEPNKVVTKFYNKIINLYN